MGKRIVTVAVIVGARPNFMKAAPILRVMQSAEWRDRFKPILIHTGQHYDATMSDVFFKDLDMPKPDVYLGVGSMERDLQIETIRKALVIEFAKRKLDLVIVVGDVNSTLAAALAANDLGIKIAHVEAGLRSFDMTMPEEENRIETDKISDFLFTTEPSANENLKQEGVRGQVQLVGNTMIDSLAANLPRIQQLHILDSFQLKPRTYAVLTLHRPSNVDDHRKLAQLLQAIAGTGEFNIVFPVHPRTRKQLEQFPGSAQFVLTEPLGYLDFLKLVQEARFVMTDSGGIQEETTYLGVPCITLRNTTERPVTISEGTNILVKPDNPDFSEALTRVVAHILGGKTKRGQIPFQWDGKAAERIVRFLDKALP